MTVYTETVPAKPTVFQVQYYYKNNGLSLSHNTADHV